MPLLIATLMMLMVFAPAVFLQQGGQYVIKPSVVAGGGGTSAGNPLSLSGTIGQAALGTSSGGSFSLAGGFWQAVAPCSATQINTQPTQQTVCSGASASFSVTATGSSLSYQWRKGGVNLVNGGNISGATSATLTINPATAADAASYDVVISNSCTSPVTSNAVALTVNSYMLSASNANFSATGGNGNVDVTVAGSCPWTAVSNDGFITITAGTPGSGNGTVNYTVAANTGAARSGTMTIAGQTFTVNQSSPTAIELVSFNATSYDKGTLIEWRTGREVRNLGFRLYREDDGKRELITPQLIAGSALKAGADLQSGGDYTEWDGAANPNASYWLEDLDLKGQSTWRGPFYTKAAIGAAPSRAESIVLAAIGQSDAGRGTRLVEPIAAPAARSAAQLRAQVTLAGQVALKISVRHEGWYRLTFSELAAEGFDTSRDPRLWQLFVEGQEVPIRVTTSKGGSEASAAIEFYGTGLDTPATDTHTYWLISGDQPGRRIETVQNDGAPATASSFTQTVERRDRSIYFAALLNGEAENFFGVVVATEPVEQALELHHLDATGAKQAIVEVRLQGVTSLPHLVQVQLNGNDLGEIAFNGQQQGTGRFAVAAALLHEGSNRLRLLSTGGASDISLVDRIRVSHPHTFTADDDSLTLTVSGGERLTIKGFTSRAVRAFDVTTPGAPLELAGEVTGSKGSYALSVTVPAGAERRLLVMSEERMSKAAALTLNRPSQWGTSQHAADLLILSRRDLFDALQPLLRRREAQGLKVELVDVEDVFDEFSFGSRSPHAIRDFLATTQLQWAGKPRFVLLVGDASYDPRNYLGYGMNDLVPTKLVDADYLETASDDWLADFDGDGTSDLAIGRLPVRTAAEVSAVVTKLLAYEQTGTPASALLVSDRNEGFDFEAASASLRGLLGGLRIQELRRGQVEAEAAKKMLYASLESGERLVNYIGHGSATAWNGQLLTAEEAEGLTNRVLPVMVLMNCLNGYFADAGSEALGEALVKAPNGGAVAAWASTGMTQPEAQAAVNQAFYRLLLPGSLRGGQGLTLGEAARQAKLATADRGVRRTWVLLGDPSMRLR
jgi:hypothetical protein